MRFIPAWARAIELEDLGVQFSPTLPFVSQRAVVAFLESSHKIILLKILIGSGDGKDAMYHKTIEQALLRGSIIRAQHPAFTQLIDQRWTTFGLVTINEYIENSFPLAQHRCLHPRRLVNQSIRLCDGVSHIHLNGSFHGDISLSNVIVNCTDEIHIVDYDFADPLPGFLRTSYSTQQKGWNTLEARQSADIRALQRLVIHLLTINTHHDCQISDETRTDAARLIRGLKQLSDEGSASSRLQRLQAILCAF